MKKSCIGTRMLHRTHNNTRLCNTRCLAASRSCIKLLLTPRSINPHLTGPMPVVPPLGKLLSLTISVALGRPKPWAGLNHSPSSCSHLVCDVVVDNFPSLLPPCTVCVRKHRVNTPRVHAKSHKQLR